MFDRIKKYFEPDGGMLEDTNTYPDIPWSYIYDHLHELRNISNYDLTKNFSPTTCARVWDLINTISEPVWVLVSKIKDDMEIISEYDGGVLVYKFLGITFRKFPHNVGADLFMDNDCLIGLSDQESDYIAHHLNRVNGLQIKSKEETSRRQMTDYVNRL